MQIRYKAKKFKRKKEKKSVFHCAQKSSHPYTLQSAPVPLVHTIIDRPDRDRVGNCKESICIFEAHEMRAEGVKNDSKESNFVYSNVITMI